MFMPIYKKIAQEIKVSNAPYLRQQNLIGWIFVPFVMEDVLESDKNIQNEFLNVSYSSNPIFMEDQSKSEFFEQRFFDFGIKSWSIKRLFFFRHSVAPTE